MGITLPPLNRIIDLPKRKPAYDPNQVGVEITRAPAPDMQALSAQLAQMPKGIALSVDPDIAALHPYVSAPEAFIRCNFTEGETAAMRKYDMCNSAAQNGGINSYFAQADMQFIEEQAQALAASEQYNASNLEIGLFNKAVYDFFCKPAFDENASWEETGAYGKQLKQDMQAVIEELAQHIKNGEDIDLHSLKTEFNLAGTKVTLGTLLDMQEAAKKIINTIAPEANGVSAGSFGFTQLAQTGIKKAAVNAFAKKAGDKLGSMFASSMNQLIDTNAAQCLRLQQECGLPTQLNTWTAQVSKSSYELFSGLDFSTKEKAQKDFQMKLSQFKGMLTTGAYGYGKNDAIDIMKSLTNAFNNTCNMIFDS